MKENLIFKPRARILLQLGDQLIRNESIALLELVKNSYDADATEISITMSKIDEPENGTIIVEDNGVGMDLQIIKNAWMEPGSDYKERLFSKQVKSKIFKRLPLGEKGIGRFGAHKLGDEIELITRQAGANEVCIQIDWNLFKKSKYLDEVPIAIYERRPEYFTGRKTGTRITIKRLRTGWTRGMLRDVYRSINSLCSPFNAPDSFKVNFDVDKDDWLKGLLTWKDIKEYALFKFHCDIEGEEIKKFRYNFTPWPTMKKLKESQITEKDDVIYKTKRMVDGNNDPINLSNYNIGKISFKALVFDRDSKILSLGVQDKQGLKKYLDQNGGIRVYRDGIRVYDYGEPGNDWLSLGIRRVNMPTKRISNNIIIGAINLSREKSTDLSEKTNREGFVETPAYYTFVSAILFALEKFENLRKIDKDKLRTLYGPTASSEPVISNIEELRNLVDRKIKEKTIKDEINNYLARIEDDYRNINEVLLMSAGAGLNLSIVIHEIEKIISELKKVLIKEQAPVRIITLVKHLANLIEGYSAIIRKSEMKKEDLRDIIEQSIFNVEYRIDAHKIKVVKDYNNYKGNIQAKCARNFIISSIMNIIDNSLWWLKYAQIKNKKIYISITDEIPAHIAIVIADNGAGFTLPTEEITKPFVSAKSGGMGLGLHLTSEIMKSHGGLLIFPEKGDLSLPQEFENGAVTVLAFKKGS